MEDLYQFDNHYMDNRTKVYYNEILSVYNNKSYREAIVSLYTLVICDIIYKLESLEKHFNDENAIRILNEVKSKQKNENNKSSWEDYIINEVSKSTEIISDICNLKINQLKKIRNISAHPILEDFQLYIPSKFEVQGYILYFLENLFSKPYFMSKRNFTYILNDISGTSNKFHKNEDFNIYVNNKYLNHMNHSTKLILFETLWKFVFILNNEECKKNRYDNYLFIRLIVNKNKDICLNYFKEHNNKFNNELNKSSIEYFLLFIFEFTEFYNQLDQISKNIIKQQFIERPYLRMYNIFEYDDLENYFKMVIEAKNDKEIKLKTKSQTIYFAIENILEILFIRNDSQKCLKYLCNLYGESYTFDEADWSFSMVKKYISNFKENDIIYLLALSENNNQTYNRKKVKEDYLFLISYCKSKNIKIDFTQFTHLEKAIE